MIRRPDRIVTDLLAPATELASTAWGLVGRADAALERVSALLGDAEALVRRTAAVVDRVDGVMTGVESVVAQVGAVTATAGEQVDLVRAVAIKADRAAAGAQGIVDRSDVMVSAVEPLVRTAVPIAARLVDAVEPHEVTAAVQILDRLPELLRGLDDDVIPMMRQLDHVGPDVHALLETVQDLRRMVEGLPGMGLLRRRGED